MSYPNYPASIWGAAKLLDIKFPNWHNNINIRKLCMDDYDACILGQLWGDYNKALRLLFGITNSSSLSEDNIFGSAKGNKQRYGGAELHLTEERSPLFNFPLLILNHQIEKPLVNTIKH